MRLIFSELRYQSEEINAENDFLILKNWIKSGMEADF
jgi:hypothetical protein